MKRTLLLASLCVAAALIPATAPAAKNPCRNVHGDVTLTLIPAANDPLGRILGPSKGSFKGAVTSVFNSLAPGLPPGALDFTSVDTWVVDEQDLLIFQASGTFTPIAGEPIGTVSETATLTVTSGTGTYAGATGTLVLSGTGYNLFGPNAGAGSTFLDLTYTGTICRAS